MAILDRPMFQRRPTKDELRAYGIPAFANGGIVVQKFAKAGEVTKPKPTLPGARAPIYPGLMFKADAAERGGTLGGIQGDTTVADTVMESFQDKNVAKSDVNVAVLDERQIENRIRLLENEIRQKKSAGLDVSAEQAELNELKNQLANATETRQQKQKEIEKPAEVVDSEKKEVVEEEEVEKKTQSITDDLGDPEKERLSDLESLVKERSELYKQILGDPKEGLKQQGLLQLAQFGLNLASAKGGNLAEKIAKSAKDPLTTFAALGREAMKDERAIDMLAIKGAEDELGRTQKTGSFGQLVQDIMVANPELSKEEAYAKSIEITSQKAGKSLAEQRNEYADKLVDLYVKEEGLEVDVAEAKANAKALDRFPSPTGDAETTSIVTITGKSDPAYDKLQSGEQYIFEGTKYTKG